MARRNGAFIRSERMREMRVTLLKLKEHNNNAAVLSKIVALFQFKFGLTKEKVMEYLRVIAELEGFTIDEERNVIFPPEDSS